MIRGGATARVEGDGQEGQGIVLFALMFVVLCGLVALAIDVSRVYSEARFDRSVADAASLAGGQDLQAKGTRNVGNQQYVNARAHALQSLIYQLKASGSSCNPNNDIVGCALNGVPYSVTIQTPSPTCVDCDPDRSVQVNVTRTAFPLTFARVFGFQDWDVGVTSVAGITYLPRYAVITLRPPRPLRSGLDGNEKDIDVTGGTDLIVKNGDIGTNTNMAISGSGTSVVLDPGFSVHHFDTYQAWVGPPQGKVIPNPIPDPNYTIPQVKPNPGGTPAFNNVSQARDSLANCTVEIAKLTAAGYVPANLGPTGLSDLGAALAAGTNTVCYKPGEYNFRLDDNLPGGSNKWVSVLEPGVYFFENGLDIGGYLIGGYQASPNPGVAAVFNESNTSGPTGGTFKGDNARLVALNAGTRFASSGGTEASPAIDWFGNPVQVNFGSGASPQIVPEALIVRKDSACTVGTTEPAGCNDSQNRTLRLPGGGNLYVAGVQYAPTDNVLIAGGSGGTGKIGQIVVWTVQYVGGSTISEEFPGGIGNGILRIDAACSDGVVCNP